MTNGVQFGHHENTALQLRESIEKREIYGRRQECEQTDPDRKLYAEI